MNQSGLISSCETKMAEITRPGNLCCVCGDYGGEGSTDLVTTLNDLGPKFEKGGKDVRRMKESAVLRKKMMGRCSNTPAGCLTKSENKNVNCLE